MEKAKKHFNENIDIKAALNPEDVVPQNETEEIAQFSNWVNKNVKTKQHNVEDDHIDPDPEKHYSDTPIEIGKP